MRSHKRAKRSASWSCPDTASRRRLGQRCTALDFFDLPIDEKLTVRRPKNDQNRGYIPYGEETLALMHGQVTPADYKEVFAIGPDDVPN